MADDDWNLLRPKAQCAKHGPTEYCLICRHLLEQSSLRFYANTAEKHAPAQAWCEACDQILDEERGWSNRADEFTDWKLFCAICYEETLTRHEFIAWAVGKEPLG